MSDSDRPVIAVDIDGTICTPHADYSQCELIPGTREALHRLRNEGYAVFLHTGRHIDKYQTTVDWLAEHEVPYDHIVFGKPPARYYVDDRAIRFESWDATLKEVLR